MMTPQRRQRLRQSGNRNALTGSPSRRKQNQPATDKPANKDRVTPQQSGIGSKWFDAKRHKQRQSTAKAKRRVERLRERTRKQRQNERTAFRSHLARMQNWIDENNEPIPPDTEVIDERSSELRKDARYRRGRGFGMLQTMGGGSYLSAAMPQLGMPDASSNAMSRFYGKPGFTTPILRRNYLRSLETNP